MKDKHIINSFKDLRKAIEEVTASQPAKSREQLQKERMQPLKEGKNLMPDIDNIVKSKGAKKVGGSMVDMFTASMIQKVYDRVNDKNKKRMEKAPIQVLVKIAQTAMSVNRKDMMNSYNFNETVEGFASDAQRRAAFASGYKAKGKKGKKKKEEVEEGMASFLDNVIKVQQSFSDVDKAEKMLKQAAKKGLIGYNGPMRGQVGSDSFIIVGKEKDVDKVLNSMRSIASTGRKLLKMPKVVLTKAESFNEELQEARASLTNDQFNVLRKAGLERLMKKHDAYVSNHGTKVVVLSSPSAKFFDELANLFKKNMKNMVSNESMSKEERIKESITKQKQSPFKLKSQQVSRAVGIDNDGFGGKHATEEDIKESISKLGMVTEREAQIEFVKTDLGKKGFLSYTSSVMDDLFEERDYERIILALESDVEQVEEPIVYTKEQVEESFMNEEEIEFVKPNDNFKTRGPILNMGGNTYNVKDKFTGKSYTFKYLGEEVKTFSQVKKELKEGTWAIPDSKSKLALLADMLKKPFPATTPKDLDKFMNKLPVGDDGLYDDLDEIMYEKEPDGSIKRPLVTMKKFPKVFLNIIAGKSLADEKWIRGKVQGNSYIMTHHSFGPEAEQESVEKDMEEVVKRKKGNIRKAKMMKFEKVRGGKLDPLSKMGGSKLTGQELQRYYKDNPKAKKAARDKNVKLGIELALDLGGNMNMAMKEIEKLKRGLTKHPEVSKALKFANEENMNESNIDAWLEDRGEEYKKFFNKMLKKFGVNSPAELSPEKKKEFFNKIEKDYDKELPKNDDGDESVKPMRVDARRKQFKEKLRKLGYTKG
ncbi:MAG: hypothetical protein CBE07_003440 [Pelagibacteraceae bacterium TMED247]|nr:MAG: hypothetical protein CBE07_003440 [Pelagibacteraceae bacterium TMED247]|tara:strand:+ start:1793 stop:4249 length:2457 start_codon:yes stop_codon:yes gene_type:complete